jgi:Bacteriocin-protection, YdeI or OmpD-Associated
MLHPSVKDAVKGVLGEVFVFPEDVLGVIRSNELVLENYNRFSPSYQRIRVAYIEAVRKRPEEFEKRLANFIRKTRANKVIGYGGIEKYY